MRKASQPNLASHRGLKFLKNQSRLEFREVEAKQKRLDNFRELVPAKVFPHVLPLASKQASGGKCPKCKQTHLYLETFNYYLSKEAAQEIRSQGAAAIGDLSNPRLCVTGKIWNRIKKYKHARGLIDYAVTELAGEAINKKPKLKRMVPFKL